MQQIENLVFDMDGVLWLGMTPITDLNTLFGELDALGLGYAFATNNASRTVDQYIKKFAKLGATVEPWQILSSAETTGEVLAKQFPTGTRAYVVGGDGLKYALNSRGFELVTIPYTDDLAEGVRLLSEVERADVVVVGFNPAARYADLAAATYFVSKGAHFVGSNPDTSFPTEIGIFPGAGALIGLVETATGVTPPIMGKPFPYIYETAMERLNSTPANTLMVGDRLNTDVAGAAGVGMQSALVLSGISRRDEITDAPARPDYVFDDVNALLAALKQVR